MTEPTRRPRALQYAAALLSWVFAACAATGTSTATMTAQTLAAVRPGIDVLLSGDMASLRGMRVGLITNHTGKTLDGRSTIDALYADKRLQLVALFAPEHGIRGAVEGGVDIAADRDSKTGLPIHSLYGKTNTPTAEMLADIDALVFDIQDVGARYYTYPWTMALAMRAAAAHHKRFVVLDRPNPIGGTLVQGNINDTLTFVGLYPVPMRHGMTVGELATMIKNNFHVDVDLVVIKAAGWRRDLWYEQTQIPWIAPSPNMPSIESATHYPGQCLFEGSNLSNARGTPAAFQQFGAPWLDNAELIRRLQSYNFPGVRFEAVTFTPRKPGDNKYDGQLVKGVKLITTDRSTYDPTRLAIAILVEVKKLHPGQFEWRGSLTRLVGNGRVKAQIDAGASLAEITKDWGARLALFEAARKPYLLY